MQWSGFCVVRNQLIAVRRDANARIGGILGHEGTSVAVSVGIRWKANRWVDHNEAWEERGGELESDVPMGGGDPGLSAFGSDASTSDADGNRVGVLPVQEKFACSSESG